ncbi:MAG: cupin domain-containing protein [Clostridia bacterium]|nr:cupin domain-containing protein [Clostridia bacterium]
MITRSEEQSHSIREFMRGGKKHVEHTLLSAALPENVRIFNVLTLIPGASIGYHVHENEIELFYFMEGNGRVRDDDQFFDVSAGDSMATFSGHGHAVENTGDTNLVILAVIVKD